MDARTSPLAIALVQEVRTVTDEEFLSEDNINSTLRNSSYLCVLLFPGKFTTKFSCAGPRFRKMKQMEVETEGGDTTIKQASPPPPPPPPPPLPRFWVVKKPAPTVSVTNQEIAKFWRQKRIEEEDHLLAALKAAARIRARNFTEDDYKRFEESLKDKIDNSKDYTTTTNYSQKDENNKELRVGIKDWWTKSKYAYLNQPAIDSVDTPKHRTSTYIPNFCFYKPTSLPPTSLGVF